MEMNDQALRNSFGDSVALTGSIATGKSTVARFLTELGAHLVDTDRIAREVVEPGRPALADIAAAFGPGSLLPDGTLNRAAVRSQIVENPAKRTLLNDLTHPHILQVALVQVQTFRALRDGNPILVDVPLLFEVGWDRWFSRIMLVYVPVEVQVRRLMERDLLDRATAERTVAAQLPVADKKAKASYIIDNAGTLEETRIQVEKTFALLQNN